MSASAGPGQRGVGVEACSSNRGRCTAEEYSNRAVPGRTVTDASGRETRGYNRKSLVHSKAPVDGVQKVRGSNPLSSTVFRICVRRVRTKPRTQVSLTLIMPGLASSSGKPPAAY
jgi:hypothetical protein